MIAGGPVLAPGIPHLRSPPRGRPPDHLGPDDPELVWGKGVVPPPEHVPYRLRPRFDAGQIAAQFSPQTDNGSRRMGYLAELCRPIEPILARRPLRVLQAGCGIGTWIGFLAARVDDLRFTGLDRSEAGLAAARERFGGLPDLRLIATDLRARLRLGAFDLVLLDYEILNHFSLAEARLLLEWAHRSLAPGGAVFGDVRLAKTGGDRRREFSCNRSGTGVLHRSGVLREGVEGRVAATWDLRSGRVIGLLQDVLRTWTVQDQEVVFQGLTPRLHALDRIATDKAEGRSSQSFLIRRP
jgi:SAM-dependent methyltransferase